jgi:hypothetical protein
MPPGCGGMLSPEAVFVSAASQLDLVDLVAAGDWLVRRRLTTPAKLLAYARDLVGPSSAATRRAASLVRNKVDSVRETRLRLMLVLAGLPEPQCNIALGSDERFIGTVDLVYQLYKLILEYEGDQHRTDKQQWNIDIGRYDEFTGEGWSVIRVTSERIRCARGLVTRVYEALRAAGYPGPAPVFSAEWLRLFT